MHDKHSKTRDPAVGSTRLVGRRGRWDRALIRRLIRKKIIRTSCPVDPLAKYPSVPPPNH
jgi:hypothetical protein